MSDRATRLHASPDIGVFYVTGGGVSFLDEMLGTAGASRSVLEARVPYAADALSELCGGRPAQSCSADTARAMAMAAFERARSLTPDQSRTFGFGCTASLATDRPKRGEHRAYIAVQTENHTHSAKIEFTKGASDRAGEEFILRNFCWQQLAIALAVDLGEHLYESLPGQSDHDAFSAPAQDAWRELILGSTDAHAQMPSSESEPHLGELLLPGSFNPLHQGHLDMMAQAEAITGLDGAFELSVENVDKPLLDYHQIQQRISQFNRPVWLTRLPTFVEKARRFPGTTFVVGIDTIVRVAAPRYYQVRDGRGRQLGNAERNRDEALAELAALACRFIVFGREHNGRFSTLDDVGLPAMLHGLCIEVDEDSFRRDISSTQLRAIDNGGDDDLR
ncbi:MAG: hypothetical protein NXH85_00680 [Pseudomonadaceae bacterium]|nr:hypothetical protein [Pseudomonadaceae bacterium]